MMERGTLAVIVASLLMAGCTSNEGDTTSPERPPAAGADPWAWDVLPDAPTPRTEVTAVVLAGELVVIGGFSEAATPSAAVEALNLTTLSWRSLTPLPVPLHHAPAVTHQGRIHVLGGYTTAAFVPTVFHFIYEPGMGLWTAGESLPRARGAHGAAVVDGQAYLVGGVGDDGLLAAVDVIDLAAGTWSEGPSFPFPRDHLAVEALNGTIHAVGGREQTLSSNTGAHHALTPGGEWTEAAPLPTPRGGIGAGVAEGLLIVAGGEQDAGTFEQIEGYEEATDTWTALPVLPTPRHGLGVVGHQDRLYVAAGGTDPGLTVSGAIEVLSMGTADASR